MFLKLGLRGRLAIIALSTVLLLGNTGFYTSPAFGGSSSDCDVQSLGICFDGGPGGTGQDWNTATNWDPDVVPGSNNDIGIGWDTIGIGTVTFDVNINSGTVDIGFGCGGSMSINGGSSLTVKNTATLNNVPASICTISVLDDATLIVEGVLNNGFTSGDLATIEIFGQGRIIVASGGAFNHFGNIEGDGTLEVCGTFSPDPSSSISGTINQVACSAGAAVGSTSIPLDSTPMLVAGSQMNTIWITLAIAAAIGIGILIIRRN